MSAETFGSHLVKVRNDGQPFKHAWTARLGEDFIEPRRELFTLGALVPYEEYTIDDLLWSLIPAAQSPTATHLEIVFQRPHPEYVPVEDHFMKLIRELRAFGFKSMEIEGDADAPSSPLFNIVISLFTEAEIDALYQEC